MRELTNEEKDDTVRKVTEGSAMMALGIITIHRHDLMQRLLDITSETLEALGVKAEYKVEEIMEGMNGASSVDIK